MKGHYYENNLEFVKSNLAEDSLYQAIFFNDDIKERLFSDTVLNLDPNKKYSSTELAEDIFQIPASTMRYYVRIFDPYIEVEISGRKKIIPYKSVFKIHMILELLKSGEALGNILIRVGLQGTTTSQGSPVNDDNTPGQPKDLVSASMAALYHSQKNLMDIMQKQLLVRKEEKKAIELQQEITEDKFEIELIKEKIATHRLERKMERQAVNVLRKSMELNKNTGGLFAGFFKKKEKVDNSSPEEILVELSQNDIDGFEKELLAEIKIIESELKDKSEKLKNLQTSINSRTNQIETMSNQIFATALLDGPITDDEIDE